MPYGEVHVFVSRVPWSGEAGDWKTSQRIAEKNGAKVVLGDWRDETSHRRAALKAMKDAGVKHFFIPDSDEVPEPELLTHLASAATSGLADIVRVRMQTYWKTTSHVVFPPEELAPILMLNAQVCKHEYIREYSGGTQLVLSRNHGLLHHLSYVGSDERIHKKVSTWGHKDELVDDWWEGKWLGWDKDPTIRDLHPTHPGAYHQIERIKVPEVLKDVDSGRIVATSPEMLAHWPTVSIVIPLYGGSEDISMCLQSLEQFKDILHEVIVVDDASPDDAAAKVAEFDFVRLISHSENLGFAAACNTGLDAVSGDIAVFLNSDTLVPRAGFIRLIESLVQSEDIGATAPYSNNAGYFQKTDPPYTALTNLDNFAEDFANRKATDEDVSMLVGLCLAMRTEFARELSGFSTDFGKGMYEDNELCFRIQEVGKRLVLSSRSFIHHKGSQSLQRLDVSPHTLLRKNEHIFQQKHWGYVQSGFASHLPGERKEPIQFNWKRHPEEIQKSLKERAERADISLCMIVRDEERVLGNCLSSVADVFNQKIIVDTGSTDRTVEIAKEFGAEVHKITWPDSFADARNESLKYAKGKWIFWLDADDTLPIETAEQVLHAAIHAPDDVIGFVVPVQFVDGPDGQGTRVDHVKLFRNLPGVEFEGRIHEQILGSLRKQGGEIQRINAVVLHSGYDTSDIGQAKKKKRDSKLLLLDLQDRPGHPFVLFNLGMTAHYNGDHKEAIDWFRQCLDVSTPEESHVRKVFALLSASLRAIGLQDDSGTVLSDGLRHYNDDPELLFLRGVSYMNSGRFGEARLDLEKIPEGTPGHFASFDTGIQGYKKYFNLGICCKELGDFVAARHYLLKTIESGGGYVEPAEILFDSALRRRDFLVCEEVVALVEVKDNRGEFWGSLLLRLLNSQGIDAPSYLRQKQAMNPHDPRVGVLLSKCLLEAGRFNEAQPILLELLRAGIPDASFFMGVAEANNRNFVSAKSFFEETLILNPNHAGAKKYLEIIRENETS